MSEYSFDHQLQARQHVADLVETATRVLTSMLEEDAGPTDIPEDMRPAVLEAWSRATIRVDWDGEAA